jgi:hypothetical protein
VPDDLASEHRGQSGAGPLRVSANAASAPMLHADWPEPAMAAQS